MAKILVVDDSEIMRNILYVVLEKTGHEIVGNAANGMEALKLYGELNPELVLCDILMPDVDGITFLEEVLQLDPKARVVMISALGHGLKEKEARRCGAVGYISKPFQPEDLLEEIRNALAE